MANTKKKPTKKEIEFQKYRHNLGMKYGKTTLIRYATALLAVVSIYWLFLTYLSEYKLIFLPLIYFIGYIVCLTDQYLSLHGHKENIFNWTDIVMKLGIILNVILIGTGLYDYQMLFPYFSSATVAIAFMAIGILIKFIIIYKIKKFKKQ